MKYKGVGWYVADGTNENSTVSTVVVVVEAVNMTDAFDKAERALFKASPPPKRHQLLNWCVKAL